MRLLPGRQHHIATWGDPRDPSGSTAEVAVWPTGTSYAQRDFTARISVATVDVVPSRFTPLPGVQRIMMPLDRTMRILVEGREREVPALTTYRFDGATSVVGHSAGRDLGVMLRGIDAVVDACGAGPLPASPTTVVYALHPVVLTGADTLSLEPGDAAVLTNEPVEVHTEAEGARVVTVTFSADPGGLA